jgi:hypothetical protein
MLLLILLLSATTVAYVRTRRELQYEQYLDNSANSRTLDFGLYNSHYSQE